MREIITVEHCKTKIEKEAGLGFSSDFSWNIVSVIAYELPWYRITPIIGYRALYDDYSDGSGNDRFAYNAWLHGPVLGVAFRF